MGPAPSCFKELRVYATALEKAQLSNKEIQASGRAQLRPKARE